MICDVGTRAVVDERRSAWPDRTTPIRSSPRTRCSARRSRARTRRRRGSRPRHRVGDRRVTEGEVPGLAELHLERRARRGVERLIGLRLRRHVRGLDALDLLPVQCCHAVLVTGHEPSRDRDRTRPRCACQPPPASPGGATTPAPGVNASDETTATPSPAIAEDGDGDRRAHLALRHRRPDERRRVPAPRCPSSQADDNASDQPTLSGVQASGRSGTPQTRDTAQTPRIPAFRITPAVSISASAAARPRPPTRAAATR